MDKKLEAGVNAKPEQTMRRITIANSPQGYDVLNGMSFEVIRMTITPEEAALMLQSLGGGSEQH